MTTPVKKRAEIKRRLEVNTGTDETPVWTPVKGLNSITLNIDGEVVDVSDYDSGGWQDNLTTFHNWGITVEGFEGFTGTNAAPVEDPGQEALRAKGLLLGDEAYATVRLYRLDTLKGYTGRVTVNWKGLGGGVKAASPFNCDLQGSGALTTVTVVVGP